jgi:ATP-dependent Lhr-like helicase
VRWWTWAGARANGVVAAALAATDRGLVDELDRYDNRYIKLRGDATAGQLRQALRESRDAFGDDLAGMQAPISEEALKQLKFADLLPPGLAEATLAARAADPGGCSAVAASSVTASST